MNETSERSPGRRLREARERMNLTAARVAEQLRLEPQRLAALEADRFDELGAAVYVRGHLRKYAELVGLPADELLALFAERGESMPAPSLIPAASARDLSVSRRRNPMPALAVGALVLVVAALWWWYTHAPAGVTAGASGPDATPPADVAAPAPADVDPAPGFAAGIGDSDSPSAADVTATEAAEQAAPALPAAVTTSPAPEVASQVAAAGAAELQLRFRTQSWFEVYDPRDRRLAFELVPAGGVRTVRGAPPLRVLLGNATGVTLSLDGREVRVPRALRVADTAWIQIDAKGGVSEAARRQVGARDE